MLFSTQLIIQAFLCAVFSYIISYYYKYFTRSPRLNGPLPVPIFGNAFELIRTRGEMGQLSQILHKKYGDLWEFNLFGQRQIWLCNADLVANILGKSLKTNYFHRTPVRPELEVIESATSGIFTQRDFGKWRFIRKLLVQALMSAKFTKTFVPITQTLFSQLEGYLLRLDSSKPINIQPWIQHFTGEVMIKITTHRDFKMMAEYFNSIVPEESKVPLSLKEEEECKGWFEMIEKVLKTTAFLTKYPSWIRNYIPSVRKYGDKLVKDYKGLWHGIEKEFVQRRRAEIENTPVEQDLTPDLLTQLCIANTPRGGASSLAKDGISEPLTDSEIGRLMVDVFFAGTDTTAHSICFLIYFLCKYPDVKARIIKEIDDITGRDPNHQMTHEQLEKFCYLDAVIKEVARVNPVTHFMARTSAEQDEFSGYVWPANTFFMINVQSIHNQASDWEEPEKFNPDRWLKKQDNQSQKPKFLQFGYGIRECPGRFLSMSELKVVLILLFNKYEVTLADEKAELKSSSSELNMCTELMVFIKPRAE